MSFVDKLVGRQEGRKEGGKEVVDVAEVVEVPHDFADRATNDYNKENDIEKIRQAEKILRGTDRCCLDKPGYIFCDRKYSIIADCVPKLMPCHYIGNNLLGVVCGHMWQQFQNNAVYWK